MMEESIMTCPALGSVGERSEVRRRRGRREYYIDLFILMTNITIFIWGGRCVYKYLNISYLAISFVFLEGTNAVYTTLFARNQLLSDTLRRNAVISLLSPFSPFAIKRNYSSANKPTTSSPRYISLGEREKK